MNRDVLFADTHQVSDQLGQIYAGFMHREMCTTHTKQLPRVLYIMPTLKLNVILCHTLKTKMAAGGFEQANNMMKTENVVLL